MVQPLMLAYRDHQWKGSKSKGCSDGFNREMAYEERHLVIIMIITQSQFSCASKFVCVWRGGQRGPDPQNWYILPKYRYWRLKVY